MTIKEAENFYKQDRKEYNLTMNTIINNWLGDLIEIEQLNLKQVVYPENYGKALKNSIKGIYKSIKNIKNLQDLIDYLTTWYEIKYPDREMDTSNGRIIYPEYKNIEPLSKRMDSEQLLYRLNATHKDIISCYYRSGSWSAIPVIINNEIICDSSIGIILKIKNEINNLNNDFFLSIYIDYKTGLIPLDRCMDFYLKDYIKAVDIKRGYIHIEELVNRLEKNKTEKIDYIQLLETVLERKLRLKIRKEILELSALKMLYSENTIPEYGYERAKRFISEMNKKLNANITTERIDEIMSRNYKEEKKLIKKK